jgi:hypothetical protein
MTAFLASTLPFFRKSAGSPADDSRDSHLNVEDVADLSDEEMRRIIDDELIKFSRERIT